MPYLLQGQTAEVTIPAGQYLRVNVLMQTATSGAYSGSVSIGEYRVVNLMTALL